MFVRVGLCLVNLISNNVRKFAIDVACDLIDLFRFSLQRTCSVYDECDCQHKN
jgi:hypothetical protein